MVHPGGLAGQIPPPKLLPEAVIKGEGAEREREERAQEVAESLFLCTLESGGGRAKGQEDRFFGSAPGQQGVHMTRRPSDLCSCYFGSQQNLTEISRRSHVKLGTVQPQRNPPSIQFEQLG